MYYFFFEEPKQIRGLSVESLADYIKLLSEDGELYRQFRNEFVHKDNFQSIDSSEETFYQIVISKKEIELKNEYAISLDKGRLKDDGEKPEYAVFYRGISNKSFQPVPSVYRNNTFNFEERFINDIRVNNPDFVSGKTFIDELSALQHYGCPTRLLDLTRNPLVALYFACEDAANSDSNVDGCVEFFLGKEEDVLHSNSDRVLILAALSHLTRKDKDNLFDICKKQIYASGDDARLIGNVARRHPVEKLYQEIGRVASFEKKILCMDLLQSYYVQPPLNNSRIRAQNGLFILNGLCSSERECSIRNENKIFAKIIIPSYAKKKILEELDKMNINEKTLFPEIEDTVKYLKKKYK